MCPNNKIGIDQLHQKSWGISRSKWLENKGMVHLVEFQLVSSSDSLRMVNHPQGLKMMKLFEDQEEKGPGRVDFLRDIKYRLVCAWLACLSLPRCPKTQDNKSSTRSRWRRVDKGCEVSACYLAFLSLLLVCPDRIVSLWSEMPAQLPRSCSLPILDAPFFTTTGMMTIISSQITNWHIVSCPKNPC